jgi:peptide/nickel transport system permease protein
VIGYLIRRVVQAVVVVFGVTLLVFLLEHVVPGGAARAALGQRATPASIHEFNKVNGYDLPIWQQFYDYCRDIVLHFNLGYSYKKNQAVSALIEEDLPKTLVLVGISTLVAVIIAVPLGVLQVVRRNKPIDYVLTVTTFILYALPEFLLGQLLFLYFAIDLGWFSTEAPQASSTWGILSEPGALVLPVLSLAAITIAAFSR